MHVLICRETNLKLRSARLETNGLNTPALLSALRGTITADAPNNNLHKFNGAINPEGKDSLSVNNDHVLLRVCNLMA